MSTWRFGSGVISRPSDLYVGASPIATTSPGQHRLQLRSPPRGQFSDKLATMLPADTGLKAWAQAVRAHVFVTQTDPRGHIYVMAADRRRSVPP